MCHSLRDSAGHIICRVWYKREMKRPFFENQDVKKSPLIAYSLLPWSISLNFSWSFFI
jgi:hypothetical protein